MTKGIGGSTAAAQLQTLQPWASPAPAIAVSEYEARLEKARALMATQDVDALVVGAGASLRYFSRVAWGATERLVAMILPKAGKPIFICPAFEEGTLLASLAIEADIRCWEEDHDPYALAAACLKELGAGKTAVDPAMAFSMVGRLSGHFGKAFVDASAIVDGCRSCKTTTELALMQQAKSMTLEVHRRAALMLQPGVSATAVRRFIEDAHRKLGAAGSSFCIVLFGEATSYPHGVPGELYLKEGDMVLIDTGCLVEGYNSDITRSYVYGEATAAQRQYWQWEHGAQAAAFAAAKPGVPCENVDQAARDYLEKNGMGPDYTLPGLPHRTGHGIGLSIHEAPYLVRGDKTPLAPGMCFSNEPMVVVPGQFGIRLEDHFYMAEDGPVWFTEPSPSIEAPFG